MTHTVFSSGTVIASSWLNDVDTLVYGPPVTSSSANIGFLQSGTGAVLTNLQQRDRQSVSVFDFMTAAQIADVQAGTLLQDVTSALSAANTAGAGGLLFPKGSYKITGNLTFTVPCVFQLGSILSVATTKVVTFNQQIIAGLYQIFSLAGTASIVVNAAFTGTGFPEWWGAQINTAGFDSLAAINACIIACRVTQLQAADYYISSTIFMQTPHRTLQGMGFDDEAIAGTVTRILVTNGSSKALQMGPNSQPGSINAFMKELRIKNFFISRTVAPVISSGCMGIDNRFTLYSYVDNVKSTESLYTFNIYSVVNAHYNDNYAFRSLAGTGGGSDLFYGYFLDGSNIIGSGGNASLFMRDCNANLGGISLSNSNGYYLNLTWADTWITNGEVTACAVGYQFAGNTSTSINANQVDCHLINPIVDQFTLAGLFFNGTNEYGQITVTGGYAAPAGTGTPTACVYYTTSKATVRMTGFQCICQSNAAVPGIVAISSYNIASACLIGECSVIPINLTTIANSRFDDDIRNYSVSGSGAAVSATGSQRCKYNVTVSGKATAFTKGYETVTSSNYNEMNVTGIDTAAINGVAANKFVRLGVQQTAVGLNGTTDYTSGVVA
jgi:hypothetical protein